MGLGLVEIAGVMLSRAEQRVEVSAQNLANTTTPGYKAHRAFASLVASDSAESLVNPSMAKSLVDFANGQLRNTGNPFDLAISGSGFFVVQSKDGTFYTRNGQFSRDSNGRLVTAAGMALQSTGGDVVMGDSNPTILADGTVLDGQEPVSRIALVNFADTAALRPVGGGLFQTAGEAAAPINSEIRQGMLEASNVSTADEMIAIMASLRGAGSGQRLVQLYDDLMGRVITSLGQQS